MFRLSKEQPAGGKGPGQVHNGGHGKTDRMTGQPDQQQRRHDDARQHGNRPQSGDMAARDDMDHLAQQVVLPGVGLFKHRRLANPVKPGGAADGLGGLGKSPVADPKRGNQGGGDGKAACQGNGGVPGQHRAARDHEADEQGRRGPVVPTRNGFHLGVDHRGGTDRCDAQHRAQNAQALWPAQTKPIRQRNRGQQKQRRDRGPGLARQPRCPPLGKGAQKTLRIAKVEGRGQQAANRQRIAKPPVQERRPACRGGQAKTQQGKAAKTHAGEDSEQDHRRRGVHQIFPRTRSSQPAKPVALMSRSGASRLASCGRSFLRGARYLLVGLVFSIGIRS